jgi:predicted DNA-binding ribbon-helix-helix protein
VLQDPVSVTLDLEEPQIERLREIADERGVSVASLIRQAVDAFLARRKKK